MTPIPSHHHRTRAAAVLASRGIYPKQGVLHGLMYPMTFVAGLVIGTALGGLPTWIATALGLVALAAGWSWGSSVDRRYDQTVDQEAAALEAGAL